MVDIKLQGGQQPSRNLELTTKRVTAGEKRSASRRVMPVAVDHTRRRWHNLAAVPDQQEAALPWLRQNCVHHQAGCAAHRQALRGVCTAERSDRSSGEERYRAANQGLAGAGRFRSCLECRRATLSSRPFQPSARRGGRGAVEGFEALRAKRPRAASREGGMCELPAPGVQAGHKS